MSSTASRILKKDSAHSSKSANQTGKTADLIRQSRSYRALTLPNPRHTLNFQFAGKGSGEGRENRPRSRHCNRLNVPRARLPSRAAEASAFREKKRCQKPQGVSRGFFVAQ